MRRVALVIAVVIGVALTVAPAVRAGEDTVEIPPTGHGPGAAIAVDESLISDWACDYCAAAVDPAGDPAPERFFFGDLALRSVDRLLSAPADAATVRELFGNLFVSGYFGGIWLRDNVGAEAATAVPPAGGADDLLSWFLGAIGGAVFGVLDSVAGGLAGLARDGDGLQVGVAGLASFPLLLAVHGYNRGYLEVALAHPPEGVEVAPDALVCRSFLDCDTAAFALPVLDGLETLLPRLDAGRTWRWRLLRDWTQAFGVGAVESGRAVWEHILSGAGFAPAAYSAIIDLSAGFLLVTEATVLANMAGFGARRGALARRGLLAEAALVVWAGAYFMGLVSPLPPGTAPVLHCPGAGQATVAAA